MIKPIHIVLFLSLLVTSALNGQNTFQTVRGNIFDKESKKPLAVVEVLLIGQTDTFHTLSNSNGEFILDNVNLGRYTLIVSGEGYRIFIRPDIVASSAKQVVINVELEADVQTIKEAVVTVKNGNPSGTNNDLVLISGRQFTTDQTNRYAGSLMDPSRMAGNFAGVSGTTSQRNDIVIRGNSPMGLLWRLDGIDIPNPNHFSAQGTTGGPVSMLNNNNLANSDFLTGAFPAEYGNAMGGVFDLRMRDGNNQKREYTGQVGFNGFEFGAEGPISKLKKSSYMINYRYSTLGAFDALGINLTYAGIPYYQDISFKFSFPNTRSGTWSITGVGGKSHIDLLDSDKDSSTLSFGSVRNNIRNGSSMAAAIVSNTFRITKGYFKTSLAFTHDGRFTRFDTLDEKDAPTTTYGEGSGTQKLVLHSFLNKKLGAKNTIRTGVIASGIFAGIHDSVMQKDGSYSQLRNLDRNTMFAQIYSQWKHNFSNNLVSNLGLYGQYLASNGDMAIEPRAGLRYSFSKTQSLSAGVGLHSQMQPLEIYYGKTFIQSENKYVVTNENLSFSRAWHYIIGYDYQVARNLRFRAESYYQKLFKVPVAPDNSAYSVLNLGADFGGLFVVDSLVNKGTGTNYGLELTLEKFFSQNYYILLTGSFFDSKYTSFEGKTFNTAFNGNYVVNALAGYEKALGKRKKSVIGINMKFTTAGGRRYTPVNMPETIKTGDVIYDWSKAFSEQFKDYVRTDIKVSYKLNGKKVSQEWALDIQNFFDNKNPLNLVYDRNAGAVRYEYQQGRLPMMFYRIQF